MSKFQVDAAIEDLDKAMTKLRDAMAGIQVRTAGFKKEHDELARKVDEGSSVGLHVFASAKERG